MIGQMTFVLEKSSTIEHLSNGNKFPTISFCPFRVTINTNEPNETTATNTEDLPLNAMLTRHMAGLFLVFMCIFSRISSQTRQLLWRAGFLKGKADVECKINSTLRLLLFILIILTCSITFMISSTPFFPPLVFNPYFLLVLFFVTLSSRPFDSLLFNFMFPCIIV